MRLLFDTGREEKPVKQPSAKVPVSAEGGGRVPAGGVAIARPEQMQMCDVSETILRVVER